MTEPDPIYTPAIRRRALDLLSDQNHGKKGTRELTPDEVWEAVKQAKGEKKE